MKKLFALLGVVSSSVAAFAAEGDITAAQITTDMLTPIQTNVNAMLSAALPVIGALIGVGALVWVGFLAVRLVKRGFSAGKGR